MNEFKCTLIASETKVYNFMAKIEYGTIMNNEQYSVYTPIKRKCPTIVKVINTDYETGSVSISVAGYDDRYPNREESNKKSNELINFLENDDIKVLKDWNGNIKMVRFTNCTISYDANYGNGITVVKAQWTEQGDPSKYPWVNTIDYNIERRP